VSSDRDIVLARIRSARPADPHDDPEVPRNYVRDPARAGELDVLDLFDQRLDHVGARHPRCPHEQVPDTVADLLRDAGASDLITPPGLPAEWLPATGFRWRPDESPLPTAEIDGADGVVSAMGSWRPTRPRSCSTAASGRAVGC
jgi:L-lactate dehydrogenase complex protein LldG